MAIYSTTHQSGIDVNAVFMLDLGVAPEYPAPPFQPGELAWGTDGSEWVYCTASITIAAGNAVLINPFPGSWSVGLVAGATVTQVGTILGALATLTTTTPMGELIGVVGGSTGSMVVPAPTGTQVGAYFWVQRAGNCPALSMNTSGALFTAPLRNVPASPGSLTSGASGGTGTTYQITGIVWSCTTPTAGSVNPAILNYPYVSAAA